MARPGKPIKAINIKTKENFNFNSSADASRELQIDNSSISKVLQGKRNSAGGYYFEHLVKERASTIVGEVWRSVTGFEKLYEVSNKGRVKSLDRTIKTKQGNKKLKGMVLKDSINDKGYHHIKLYKAGVRYSYKVHRLVAREFCGGYSEELQVNHKDLDKSNNCYDNLEWVTEQENIDHYIGTHQLKNS